MENALFDCSDVNGCIWEAYFDSSVQQLAYSTIITELVKGDIQWVKKNKSGKATPIIKYNNIELEVGPQWYQFIRMFVLHLMLFGYVVYRLAPKKGRSSMKTSFEIAPPAAHSLVFDNQTGYWNIKSTDTSIGQKLRGTKMWNLSILAPPVQYSANGRTITRPTSAGYKSLIDVFHLKKIEEYFRKRDEYNSTPTVYTQVSKSITATTDGKRPWFQPSALPSYNDVHAPDAPQDFNTLVEDRAEAIQKLDEISERARIRARQMYNSQNPNQIAPVGAGMKRKHNLLEHKELIVSDGRDAQPAPYLRAPEHVQKTIDTHTHRIMFSWSVPPQVLGQNINSERTAASNRLSDMAISNFDANIKILRELVQTALQKMTCLLSRSPDVYIQCASCVNAYTLTQLEGILTTDACADMYSCVYQVPRHFIDMDALRDRQQTINSQAAEKNRVEQSSGVAVGDRATHAEGTTNTKNRPNMSQQQKDARAIAKSKQPTT